MNTLQPSPNPVTLLIVSAAEAMVERALARGLTKAERRALERGRGRDARRAFRRAVRVLEAVGL